MEITYKHLPLRVNNPKTPLVSMDGFILHYVANPKSTALQNANYFANVNEKISVQYIVDDIVAVEIIPPNCKAYGTSKGEYNARYIQIEMCHPDTTGKISAKTLDNVVWLCQTLIKKYNMKNPKIIRHYDVTGKKCPLWYVNNPKEWEALVKRITAKGDGVMSATASEITTVEQALNRLMEKKIINSPDYWVKAVGVVKYLDSFIINVAKAV